MATPYEESVSYSPSQQLLGFSPMNAAREIAPEDKSMQQLAQFSETLGKQLIEYQKEVNKDQMMEGYNLALSEPNSTDVSNEIKQAGTQLKADEMDANEVAFDIIKSGESLEVAQAVQNMSGWKRYGYAKGQAEQAGAGWDSYLSGQFVDNSDKTFFHPETSEQFTLADTATDPALRAYAITEMRKDYLEKNGLTLMKPAFLNEFAGKKFRDGQNKFVEEAREARVVQRGQQLAEQAMNEFVSEQDLGKLFNQLKVAINDKGKPFKPSEIWTKVTDTLKAYQKSTGLRVDVAALKDQLVPGDPKGRTYGEASEARMLNLENELDADHRSNLTKKNTEKRVLAQADTEKVLDFCQENPQKCALPGEKDKFIEKLKKEYGSHNVKELVNTINNDWPAYSNLDDKELLNERNGASLQIDSLDLDNARFNTLSAENQEFLKEEKKTQDRILLEYGTLIGDYEKKIDSMFQDETSKFGQLAPQVRRQEKTIFKTKLRNLYREGATRTQVQQELQVHFQTLSNNVLEGKFGNAPDPRYNRDSDDITNPYPNYFKNQVEGSEKMLERVSIYNSASPEAQSILRQTLFRGDDLKELAKRMEDDPFLQNVAEQDIDLYNKLDTASRFARTTTGTHFDVIRDSLDYFNSTMEPAQQIQIPIVNVRQSALNSAVGGSLADKFILGDLSSRQARRFKQSTGIAFSRNMNLTDGERQVLDVIGRYESDPVGSYDAVNQFGEDEGKSTGADKGFYSGPFSKMSQHGGQKLTDLTVGEIMDLQYDDKSLTMEQWKQQGKLWAVGRYQFTTPTFSEYVKKMGISRDQKFTQDLQDEMAIRIYKDRGWKGVWVGLDGQNGATPQEQFILNNNR